MCGDVQKHSKVTCDRLLFSSTVTCIFCEEIDDELRKALEKLKKETQLEKLVVVVLHKKDNEKTMKKAASKLQKTFELGNHQIIRRSVDDVNFSYVEGKLKKSVESIIKNRNHRISVSAIVQEMKEKESMTVDDSRSYIGLMAAQSILKDIDEINRKKSGSAKAHVLPLQSDFESRREIAKLDKEQIQTKERRRHR